MEKSNDQSTGVLDSIGSVFSMMDMNTIAPSVSSVTDFIPSIPNALNPQTLIFGPASSESSLQSMLTTSLTVCLNNSTNQFSDAFLSRFFN